MPDFLAEVLTWPHNYYNNVAVETAMKWGIPPTSLLSDGDTTSSWSRADKKLAMAYTILNRETCRKCGQPLWICRSTNKDLTFHPRKDKCFATEEFEKYSESKNGKNLKKGEYIYVTPEMPEGMPLPSRKEYFESLDD